MVQMEITSDWYSSILKILWNCLPNSSVYIYIVRRSLPATK